MAYMKHLTRYSKTLIILVLYVLLTWSEAFSRFPSSGGSDHLSFQCLQTLLSVLLLLYCYCLYELYSPLSPGPVSHVAWLRPCHLPRLCWTHSSSCNNHVQVSFADAVCGTHTHYCVGRNLEPCLWLFLFSFHDLSNQKNIV